MFQVHSKVVSYTIYIYTTFEIIFHHRLLQDVDYNSLHYMVNIFLLRDSAFSFSADITETPGG